MKSLKNKKISIVISILVVVALVLPTIFFLTSCADKKNFKVGVLYEADFERESSYDEAHRTGILAGAKKGKIDASTQVLSEKNVTAETAPTVIKKLLDNGCKMIISTSPKFAAAVQTAALANKKVIFDQYNGYTTDNDVQNSNLHDYGIKLYEAFYVAGIVAANETKTKTIGFVSAFGAASPDSASVLNAFKIGAKSVNPNVKVEYKVIGARTSVETEKLAVANLVALNADILAYDTDGLTVPNETIKLNKKFVSFNNNKYSTHKNSIGEVEYNLQKYYSNSIVAAIKGPTYFRKNMLVSFYEGIGNGNFVFNANRKIISNQSNDFVFMAVEIIKQSKIHIFMGDYISMQMDPKKANESMPVYKYDKNFPAVAIVEGNKISPHNVFEENDDDDVKKSKTKKYEKILQTSMNVII